MDSPKAKSASELMFPWAKLPVGPPKSAMTGGAISFADFAYLCGVVDILCTLVDNLGQRSQIMVHPSFGELDLDGSLDSFSSETEMCDQEIKAFRDKGSELIQGLRSRLNVLKEKYGL